MKKIIAICLNLLVCLSLAACRNDAAGVQSHSPESGEMKTEINSTAENNGEPAASDIPEAEPETIPGDLPETAYYHDDELNDVLIERKDDGTYRMVVGLFRLTEIEGPATLAENGFILSGVDASGDPIRLSFYPEASAYTLKIEESTWEYLATGQTFPGFTPDIKEE